MDFIDAKNETTKYKTCLLIGCFLITFVIICRGGKKEYSNQLMTLMMEEVQMIHPRHRNRFIDLCVNKEQKCTAAQFQGPNAIFSWRAGVDLLDKVHFWGTYSCVYSRKLKMCPVNGGWTEWTHWSSCKAQCRDSGWQVRLRVCENPKPSFGGLPCIGVKSNNRSCIGGCTSNANGADEAKEYIKYIHSRVPNLEFLCIKRHCAYEAVQGIIKDINKVDKYWSSIVCVKYNGPCPLNGGWGPWSHWSRCSINCGFGETFRRRKCNKPTTKNGGTYCRGPEYIIRRCLSKIRCAYYVSFTEWSIFSPCSITCGKYGVKSSVRACLNPNFCRRDGYSSDNIVRTIPCYGGPCPQIGGWGNWGQWTPCSAVCGTGRRARLRFCDRPPPSNGEECPGLNVDVESCDGHFCGQPSGRQRKRRSNSNLGLPKSGEISTALQIPASSHFYTMQDSILEVNDERNASFRSRSSKSGQTETLPSLWKKMKNDTSHKDEKILLFKPNFTAGDDWHLENNNCIHDFERHRGKRYLKQVHVDENDPFNQPLNVELEPLYTSWTSWTACSMSCGGGIRHRTRTCKNKNIVCRGEIKPQQFCNADPCPVAGGWGSWMSWTPCSVICGGGDTERHRPCNNPLPSFGGSCYGISSQVRRCYKQECRYHMLYTWTDWTHWTGCSAKCGGGFRKRLRYFSYVKQYDYRICNLASCKVNGLWSAWGSWSKCSLSCGLGHTYRDRTCTDPAPMNGGKLCKGPGSEIQKCYGGPCKDDDDYGILLRGNGFVQYLPKGVATGFFMIFMRIKIIQEIGTLFHQTNQCKGTGVTDCDVSILMSLAGRNVRLEVKMSSDRDGKTVVSKTSLQVKAWQDVFIIVAEGWIGMRLNDDDYVIEKFPTRLRRDINLDGNLTIGANRLKKDGFNGEIGVLRRNFQILLLFNMKTWSGFSAPSESKNIEKIHLPSEVRHPNFKGRYYSQLSVHASSFLEVVVVFQLTIIDGLLIYNGGLGSNSSVAIILRKGAVQFCLNYDQKQLCRKAYELKTGEWYFLQVKAKKTEGHIRMNAGNAMQITYPAAYSYHPGNSLYVGGAGPLEWPVIIENTKNNILLYGIIDTLAVNDLVVTYKMASIIDINGWVNTLGYSLADHVTEVYEHPGASTVLRCGVPRKLKEFHKIQIFWLRDMRRIMPTVGIDIMESDSLKQTVSRISIKGSQHIEGVYSCILSSDGVLVNLHVFVLMHYFPPLQKDKEAQMEWIFFIIILLLILLVGVPLVVYNCTKHHPFWKKFSWLGDFFDRVFSIFRKKTTEADTGNKPLLDSEESSATGATSSASETSDSSAVVEMPKQEQPAEIPPVPSAPEPVTVKQDQPVTAPEPSEAPTPVPDTFTCEPYTSFGMRSRNPSFSEQIAIKMPPQTHYECVDPCFDWEDEAHFADSIPPGFPGAQNAPFLDTAGIVPPAFGGSNYTFGNEACDYVNDPYSSYPSDPLCQPNICQSNAPTFIPRDVSCIPDPNPDTIKHIDFLRNPYYLSGILKPCNLNQNNPSTLINTINTGTDFTDNNCGAVCMKPDIDSENNHEASQHKNVEFYNKKGTSHEISDSPKVPVTSCPERLEGITRDAFQKDLSDYDPIFKSSEENKSNQRTHEEHATDSLCFSEFTLHNMDKLVHNRSICSIELSDVGTFGKDQKNRKKSKCKTKSKKSGFSSVHVKCKKTESLVYHTDDMCSHNVRSSQQHGKYESLMNRRSAVGQKSSSVSNDESANLSVVNLDQQSSTEAENQQTAQKQELSGNNNDSANLTASRFFKQTIPVDQIVKRCHVRTKSVSIKQDTSQDTSSHRTDLHRGNEHSNPCKESLHRNILTTGSPVLQAAESNQEVAQLNVTESGQCFRMKGGKIIVKKVKQKP